MPTRSDLDIFKRNLLENGDKIKRLENLRVDVILLEEEINSKKEEIKKIEAELRGL
ncbi:MAG: hypothetical protein P1P85_00695 [Patescibacteria group bacterium]|nr:hypothetical protein [Patescibacteria group bacterium]